MPKTTGEKRVTKGYSLPPVVATRLASESNERDLSESKLVEKGLGLLFAHFDTPAVAGGTGSR